MVSPAMRLGLLVGLLGICAGLPVQGAGRPKREAKPRRVTVFHQGFKLGC